MGSAEDEIRSYEASLRELLEATQDAVVFIDDGARITRANRSAERMFGYEPGELLGQKVDVLMPAPYRDEHDDYIERFESTGKARAVGRIRRVEAVRKDGTFLPIELSVTRLAMDDGVRYAAFIRDVSVAMEMQRQVLHHEKLAAIGTTTAKLAHEIGNPLNNLTIQTRLLDRRLQKIEVTDEVLDECVASIRNELGRLRRLLAEFRLLARRDHMVKSPCDLGLVVTRVANMAPSLSDNVEVTFDVPDVAPRVSADADKITQVLLNLAINAVEAMPQGGKLHLVLNAMADDLVVRVTDTGGGIPEGVDVFEPFVTTKPTGTGLGLAISRQIVSSHDGTIAYERREGGGTTFVLRLPIDRG